MCWDNSKRVLFSKNPIHCLTVNVHLELPLRIEFALSSVLCAICWHLSFQSELNKNKSRLYLKEKESLDDNQVSCLVHRHQSASATHQLISDWFQIKTISQPKKQIILQKTDWSNAAVLQGAACIQQSRQGSVASYGGQGMSLYKVWSVQMMIVWWWPWWTANISTFC